MSKGSELYSMKTPSLKHLKLNEISSTMEIDPILENGNTILD